MSCCRRAHGTEPEGFTTSSFQQLGPGSELIASRCSFLNTFFFCLLFFSLFVRDTPSHCKSNLKPEACRQDEKGEDSVSELHSNTFEASMSIYTPYSVWYSVFLTWLLVLLLRRYLLVSSTVDPPDLSNPLTIWDIDNDRTQYGVRAGMRMQ